MGREFVGIWMTAPLQDLLITVKAVALEKVSLVINNAQNPTTFFYHIDCQWQGLSP